MKSPTQTLHFRYTHNAAPCESAGCGARRFGVANYCLSHLRARQAHGHPLGRAIRKCDYASERNRIARLLEEQPEYPGVRAALDWLQSLLTRASYGSGAIARDEFRRLAAAGVKPRSLLIEMAAVWAFAREYPNRLPDDARLSFALAAAVLKLAPRIVKTGGTERRYHTAGRAVRAELGEALRSRLAPLLFNLATEAERSAHGTPVAFPT